LLDKITNAKIELSLQLFKIRKKEKKPQPKLSKKFSSILDELNTLPVEPIMFMFTLYRVDKVDENTKEIDGFQITTTDDKIKIFTKNLNIKKLAEIVSNLIKKDTYFVELKNEDNYEPLKKVNQINHSNIRKFIKELKTVVFKYKKGLYHRLSLIFTKNNYKKDEKMPNLFDGEINCIVKILKTLFVKKEHQNMLTGSKA
jgi:hypothetical protein